MNQNTATDVSFATLPVDCPLLATAVLVAQEVAVADPVLLRQLRDVFPLRLPQVHRNDRTYLLARPEGRVPLEPLRRGRLLQLGLVLRRVDWVVAHAGERRAEH